MIKLLAKSQGCVLTGVCHEPGNARVANGVAMDSGLVGLGKKEQK